MAEGFNLYLFLAQILLLSVNAEVDKVNVTVYYETLCPFARKFFVDQLDPVLQSHWSNNINLELIPYGKANTTKDRNGTYTFTCHHKEVECYGNQIQACAITLINNGKNTDNLGYNKESVKFIVCLMKDLSPLSSYEDVNDKVDSCIDKTTASLLKNCMGPFGTNILAHLGELTDRFQNPLGNVPTIVFNGKFDKAESDLAERDFEKVISLKLGISGSSVPHHISNMLLILGLLVLGFCISH